MLLPLLAGMFGLPARAAFQRLHPPSVVIGWQPVPENSISSATSVAVDEVHGKIYTMDYSGDRILRFSMDEAFKPGGLAEAVFGQPSFETEGAQLPLASNLKQPSGMCVDGAGRLWVADTWLNRVLRYDQAWQKPTFSPADGVLGQANLQSSSAGSGPAGLNYPGGVAVDAAGRLFVADTSNHRVLRFDNAAALPAGAAANAVLGQADFASTAAGLASTRMKIPQQLAVESVAGGQTRLWVADRGNNRVLRFENAAALANGAAASGVLGQVAMDSDGGAQPPVNSFQFQYPNGLAVHNGTLWVADAGRDRVLRFPAAASLLNGSSAAGVLGQTDFVSSTAAGGAAGLSAPAGLTVESNGRLWIADNRRALFHNNAAAKTNGAPADGAAGSGLHDGDPARTVDPDGMALDPATGRLFVSDPPRHRVLRFANEAALATGAAAEAVFGQLAFDGKVAATTETGMNFPTGLCFDGAGRLWVADTGNNRVLAFFGAATLRSGAAADIVLGQPNMNTSVAAVSATGMESPQAVCVDQAGYLWVADWWNSRVLRFNANAQRGAAALGVLGQPNMTTKGDPPASAMTVGRPTSLLAGPGGRLWVGDSSSYRVLRFDSAASKSNGAAANAVIGQPNFTATGASNAQGRIGTPTGLALDLQGDLWVADFSHARLVRFDTPAGATSPAIGLIGQENWGMGIASTELSRVRFLPTALLFTPGGSLWVADNGAGRLLKLKPLPLTITSAGLDGQGQFYLTFPSATGVDYIIQYSPNLLNWQDYATVTGNGAERTFTVPFGLNGKAFYRVVEP